MVAREEPRTSTTHENSSNNQQLTHVKNNFFESDDRITWTLYVKDLVREKTQVEFTDSSILIKFKTADEKFLSENNAQDPETQFEWNVELFGQIHPNMCSYKINKSTLEINLIKNQSINNNNKSFKWGNVIKRNNSLTENNNNVNQSPNAQHQSPEMLYGRVNRKNLDKENIISSWDQPSRKTWPERSPSSSPPPLKQPDMYKQYGNDRDNNYGYTGLTNLGNTCYMNAAIQFLVNATHLRDYFLKTPLIFQKEINTNNALGLNGKMAVQFAMLIRQLWDGKSRCITPGKLRDMICMKFAHFRGFEQQDTQEFMCSLLSVIHEDLNRVLKKPFYESSLECDSDSGLNTFKIANESWMRFLSRENSIIVDNFYGQFKSKLTCPECKKISITFEPFNNLIVPLANPKTSLTYVLFFNHLRQKRPIMLKTSISETDSVQEIINHVYLKFAELRNSNLAVSIIKTTYDNEYEDDELNGFSFDKVCSVLDKDSKIPSLKRNQLLIINELETREEANSDQIVEIRVQQTCRYPLNVPSARYCKYCTKLSEAEFMPRCGKCFRSSYCNSECQKNDWEIHKTTLCSKPLDCVGLPFIFSVKRSQLAINESFKKLLLEKCEQTIEIDSPKPLDQFRLRLVNGSNEPLKLTDELLNELFEKHKNEKRLILNINIYWLNDSIKMKTVFSNLSTGQLLEACNQDLSNTSGQVDLDDCLKLFTQPEKLTSDNPWYCSNCKKHQEATKQMNVWRLPKYLIIVLKRFQVNKAAESFSSPMSHFNRFSYLLQSREMLNKIKTLVTFPIKNLDMSKYVIENGLNKEGTKYDLCSVINHLGHSLTIGHYTSFARTHDPVDSTKDEMGWRLFDDERVTTVHHEDQIITKNAYVLMYKLRPETNTDLTEKSIKTEISNSPSTSSASPSGSISSPSQSDEEELKKNEDDDDDDENLEYFDTKVVKRVSNYSKTEETRPRIRVNIKKNFTDLNEID